MFLDLETPYRLANKRAAARFEADWGSPDALANLGATATATATNAENTNRGAEEGGEEVLGRNGANTDRERR